METAGLPPPIQAFDVSRIEGLRKRLGRAATALKVIGFVCSLFIWAFLLESHDFRLALLVALLTFGFAAIVANRLRAGRLWAVVLAAICCGWWTVRNFPLWLWLFAKPQAILGYAGTLPFSVVAFLHGALDGALHTEDAVKDLDLVPWRWRWSMFRLIYLHKAY